MGHLKVKELVEMIHLHRIKYICKGDFRVINNPELGNVYIIIGEADVKKSSVIRCLTGLYREGIYKIKHSNGTIIDTFIKTSSLQELGLTEIEFVNKVTNHAKSKHIDVLISLRINSMVHPGSKRHMNSAEDYINYFNKSGWDISKIVCFQDVNNSLSLGSIIPTLTLRITKNQPSNEIAAIVRNHFQWE